MSEADLQEHLEVQLRDRVIEFARIPDEVLKWVYANKDAPHIPAQIFQATQLHSA